MTREIFVVFFGFLVVLLPYVGVPSSMRNVLFVGSGVLLVLLGISLRHARYRRSITTQHRGELHGASFSESSRAPTPVAPAAVRAAPAVHAAKIKAVISTPRV